MSTKERNTNAHMQTEFNESGVVVSASAWLAFYLFMIEQAITNPSLGHWIELSARY
jgi:hypothetical protein